jgi:hypothetical protein
MAVKYVSDETTPLFAAATGNRKLLELLWGDQAHVMEEGAPRSKVYSTEIARSVNLGRPTRLTIRDAAGETIVKEDDLGTVTVDAKVTKAGDLNPTTVKRRLNRTQVVAGLIYGLVNVRTNGETILCATLNEKDNTWHVQRLTSRF